MKIFIFFAFSLFLLSSCLNGVLPSTSTAMTQTGLVLQEVGDFTLKVPSTWKKISLGDLPAPKSGEIVFAIASPEQRQGYINNIVVLKAENLLKESSQGLMKNAGNFLDGSLENYTLKSEETVQFTDGEEGILHTFLGKYNKQTPEVVYLQTARSCGDSSYFLTLSLAEQLESYDRYASVIQTFNCSK